MMTTVALYSYTAIGCVFAGLAVYALITWLQVRGLRGIALSMMYLGLAGLSLLLIAYNSHDSRIGDEAIIRLWHGLFWLVAFNGFVVADRYAAHANNHRALTTILYIAFQRAAEERNIHE